MELKKQFELAKITANINSVNDVEELRKVAISFAHLYLTTKELAEHEMLRNLPALPAAK